MPGRYGFRLRDHQCGFPVLPNHVQADPKQSISVVQFWPPSVAFKHGQLLAQSGILQGDLFLTAENEQNETNRNYDRLQHGDTSRNHLLEESTAWKPDKVLANTDAILAKDRPQFPLRI